MTQQKQTSGRQQTLGRQQAWDTRAWLVGIVGGAIGGSLTGWAAYPPIKNRLNGLPHPLFGSHSADFVSGAASLLTLLVLPGLLSSLARRWTFLWGVLPVSLFLVFVELEDWIENGIKNVTYEWWIGVIVIGACWVISSGPVSLTRWMRIRAARRHAALLASYQAIRESSSVPQEGVWPPPPEYRE